VVKAFFLFSQQELPAVALLLPEKIAFTTTGLSLLSGAGQLSCWKKALFSIIFQEASPDDSSIISQYQTVNQYSQNHVIIVTPKSKFLKLQRESPNIYYNK
jgi:hypothetical protein